MDSVLNHVAADAPGLEELQAWKLMGNPLNLIKPQGGIVGHLARGMGYVWMFYKIRHYICRGMSYTIPLSLVFFDSEYGT